jgi:aryl-alcohol dehydrogenase-like predicted oxidoreductase
LKEIHLGTANLGGKYGIANDIQINPAEVKSMLNWATEKFRCLDTAPDYPNAFSLIAEYSRNFCVASKVNLDKHMDVDSVTKEIDYQITSMNVDKIEILLVRGSLELTYKNNEMWNFLCRLRAEGLIGKLGFSIYEPQEIDVLSTYFREIDCFQVPINIANRTFNVYLNHRHDLIEKFEYFTRSIFLQGLLTMQTTNIPKNLLGISGVIKGLDEYAFGLSVTRVQLLLSYVTHLKWVKGVVVGANSVDQLREIYKAFENKCDFDWGFLDRLPVIPRAISDPRLWKA